MCGFFACNFEISPKQMGFIADRLNPRGPDDSIMRITKQGSYVFSRLSILDLRSSSMQPSNIHNIEAADTCLFNGEIYNYKELAKARNIEFSNGVSDTKVVEHLLKTQNIAEFVPELNGMFAIAKISPNFSSIEFCRDIFGQKPLFFWAKGQRWAVSSDLLNLTDIVETDISARFLQDYLTANETLGTRGYLDICATPFEGIYAAEPGVCYKISRDGISESKKAQHEIWQRYFLPEPDSRISCDDFVSIFTDVVQNYLQNDVRSAVTSSGGVDSSLINFTALEADFEIDGFMKIADGIDDVALSAYRQFADIPNFSLHRSDVVQDNYLTDMVKFIAYSGMPVRWGTAPSIMPVYQNIKEAGFKVCLGGDGADELFFGYQNFKYLCDDYAENQQLSCSDLLSNHAFSSQSRDQHMYLGKRQNDLLSFFREHAPEDGNLLSSHLKAMRFLDMNHFFPTIAAPHSDLCSMAHSIELRSPFLDLDIVKLANQETTSLKVLMEGGVSKALLRQAVGKLAKKHGVPSAFFENQPKEGTRNFAIQSASQLNFDDAATHNIYNLLDMPIKNSASLTPKLKFKLFSIRIFVSLFQDRQDLKSVLAEFEG